MKKYLFATALTVALVGCSRNDPGDMGSPANSQSGASSEMDMNRSSSTNSLPGSSVDTNSIAAPQSSASTTNDLDSAPAPTSGQYPGQSSDLQQSSPTGSGAPGQSQQGIDNQTPSADTNNPAISNPSGQDSSQPQPQP